MTTTHPRSATHHDTRLRRVATGVDPERWPDVAAVPRASWPVRAVTESLVGRALRRLPLRVSCVGGTTLGLGGPLIEVRDPDAFHARIGTRGLIGFGESYMAGEWDAPDLVGALTVLAAHAADLVPAPLQRLRGLWAPRQPDAQRNTPDGSRNNISRHYDLSNDLFAAFLDETLTYSSAVFRGFPADWSLLAAAQHRKIDRLLDLAEVGEGTRMLEIGTGWGELALRAAARGAHVTSLTLSEEQRALALERVREAGYAHRVSVELCDYRAARGTYDAVVSVEMIEAVGAEFWPVYFRTLDERLAPGGRVALQAITMPHQRMLAARDTHTWIQKYIFPGGLIPSTEAIEETAHDHTGLVVAARDGFGAHYADTLRLWRQRFTDRADDVAALGFDATFRRMWTFYLAYSEAGFRAGYLDVQQYLFIKEDPAR
ncbi:Tuberculostearic acid methyltransferase UfaA1 [Streptomyces sp. SudanB148_2056]|uniref:Cyclopropane-fatty-acyl-phospholipid synthase n=1 Tax=Streptomyces variabilis TaxID=67372 RepID=A0ABQ2TQL7_9ACTN|nr:cyclopropane-fatty-acyl-phospholipid synthase family protein [Streptomyces variabilis]GGP56396.1 cyclopropane-fatty-acyl-phospholipid synthase [Streptomyces griseoincarnatus]GGT34390.1 cyclopropane-fatty-acyl-phospholipid synthase [Streptomyces variabilis]